MIHLDSLEIRARLTFKEYQLGPQKSVKISLPESTIAARIHHKRNNPVLEHRVDLYSFVFGAGAEIASGLRRD